MTCQRKHSSSVTHNFTLPHLHIWMCICVCACERLCRETNINLWHTNVNSVSTKHKLTKEHFTSTNASQGDLPNPAIDSLCCQQDASFTLYCGVCCYIIIAVVIVLAALSQHHSYSPSWLSAEIVFCQRLGGDGSKFCEAELMILREVLTGTVGVLTTAIKYICTQ